MLTGCAPRVREPKLTHLVGTTLLAPFGPKPARRSQRLEPAYTPRTEARRARTGSTPAKPTTRVTSDCYNLLDPCSRDRSLVNPGRHRLGASRVNGQLDEPARRFAPETSVYTEDSMRRSAASPSTRFRASNAHSTIPSPTNPSKPPSEDDIFERRKRRPGKPALPSRHGFTESRPLPTRPKPHGCARRNVRGSRRDSGRAPEETQLEASTDRSRLTQPAPLSPRRKRRCFRETGQIGLANAPMHDRMHELDRQRLSPAHLRASADIRRDWLAPAS